MNTHFTHNHRKYRLTKRSTEPGASFYLVFEDSGQRISKSTGCPDDKSAVRWARDYLDARADDNQAAIDRLLCRPGSSGTSTVGEVLDWFETADGQTAGKLSRKRYGNCLRWVLVAAGLENVDKLRTGEALTRDNLLRFRDHITRQSRLVATQEESARLRRSAASMLNQGKAVFSLLALEDMRRAGLVLPELGEFLTTCKLVRRALLDGSTKTTYHPPTDDVIRATLTHWRALDVTQPEARNVFIAVWLGLSCGLRASEIAQVRGSWVREALLTNDGDGVDVKDGTGRLRVTPIEPFWSEGRARLDKLPDGPLLTGSPTERTLDVFRRVSELMRAAGWRTQKAAHALRALSGCWVAGTFGIYAAQHFLRHSSVTTTEKFYAVLARDGTFKPEPVSWAKVKETSNNQAQRSGVQNPRQHAGKYLT